MAGATGRYVSDVSGAAEIEEQLAATLAKTLNDLDRAECFDEEDRSELYAILKAMKSETQSHQELLGQWVGRPRPKPSETADA